MFKRKKDEVNERETIVRGSAASPTDDVELDELDRLEAEERAEGNGLPA